MLMEYLRVTFPERRVVKIDSQPAGSTNITLEIQAGWHAVTLDGPQDFTPDTRVFMLLGTTPIRPMEVVFEKKLA